MLERYYKSIQKKVCWFIPEHINQQIVNATTESATSNVLPRLPLDSGDKQLVRPVVGVGEIRGYQVIRTGGGPGGTAPSLPREAVSM